MSDDPPDVGPVYLVVKLMARCRYNDVTIEFKPLDSGYRLILEYYLVLPPPAKLSSLGHLYSEKDKLRTLLASWNDSVEKDKAAQSSTTPTLLAYICDSHYASQSLSLNALQGNDRLRASCLKDLCSRFAMGVYIAGLDKTLSGFSDWHPNRYGVEDDYHGIDTVDEDEITVTDLFTLDGKVSGGMTQTIEEENLIQSDAFDDDPDEEDYDRHHGFVTHIFRKTVSSVHGLTVSWTDMF